MADYRWTWTTIHKNLRGYWYELVYGLKAFWVLRKSVWRFRPWDYAGILGLIEDGALELSRGISRGMHHENWERDANDTLELSRLAGRIRHEPWVEEIEESDPDWVNKVTMLEQADVERFGELMKRIQYWWD